VFPEILTWRFILLNKGKNSRKVLVAILVITAVSLWIFPFHLHAREDEKKERSKRSFLEQTRRIYNTEKNKKEMPAETRKTPQTEKTSKEIPGQIKETPRIEKSENETRGEIKETPRTGKNTNETPGEIKKAPKTDKIKKKIPDESKKNPQTEKIKKKIPDEIISVSKLDRIAKEFSINRDIFSPDLMRPVDPGIRRQEIITPPPLQEEIKREIPGVDPKAAIEKEIQGLSYEGYVIKNSKNCALVSMNGEFFAVIVGDIILDKIKIIKIDQKAITVEVESNEFEIQIKEEEENEIQ